MEGTLMLSGGKPIVDALPGAPSPLEHPFFDFLVPLLAPLLFWLTSGGSFCEVQDLLLHMKIGCGVKAA